MNFNWHLLLSWAVCIVTSLASLPAIVTVAIQLRSGRAKDWFYADIDGDATPEALVKFSRRSRIFKGASVFFSAAGLGTSIAVVLVRSSASPSVFRHDSDGEILNDVLVTVAWVSKMECPSLTFSSNQSPVANFPSGCCSSTLYRRSDSPNAHASTYSEPSAPRVRPRSRGPLDTAPR
jgi:hypothetical protein